MSKCLFSLALCFGCAIASSPSFAQGPSAFQPCVAPPSEAAPPAAELVRVALAQAEMDGRPLELLGAAARWSGLLPRVRASFRRSDGVLDLFYGSTDAEALGFRQGLTDSRAWQVSAEWDLARLLDGQHRLAVARVAASIGQRRVALTGRLAHTVAEHRRLRVEGARLDAGAERCLPVRAHLLQLATWLDTATAQRWNWPELEADFLETGGRARTACGANPPMQVPARTRLAVPALSPAREGTRSPRPDPLR